ncbi:MAG: Mur ligase family protein [Candidatus Dormibacteria bacterium]
MSDSSRPAGPVGELRLPPALAGLQDRRIDVVGIAGVEGGEIARFLLAAGFTQVVGHDQQPDLAELSAAHRLAHAGENEVEREQRLTHLRRGLAGLNLGDRYLDGIEGSSLVIPSQAWFLNPANLVLHQLRQEGRPFYSLVQAYLDLAMGPVIGVTGSHGKSTTSSLVAAALRQARLFPFVWLGGNDRHNRQALEEVARDGGGQGCLVLEISNRQLLQTTTAPGIAAITNITPNHLEEHGGMAGYIACKRRIFDLDGCRLAVRNADDPVTAATGPLRPGVHELRFARSEESLQDCDGAFLSGAAVWMRLEGRDTEVLQTSHLSLRGEHNLANVLAAVAICSALGTRVAGLEDALGEGICRLGTLAHRIQLIWQEAAVDYYDDLSSTTPQSTLAAIRTVGRPVVLICGGQDKGVPFDELAAEVGASVRAVVLLPGDGSERIAQAVGLRSRSDLVIPVATLEEAVRAARELASAGEAVLLSPACPGFFSAHYRHGGYRNLLRRLSTSPRRRREPA